MLFPEEVAFLEQQAVELGQPFAVLEDLIFPDVKNSIILVGSYRLYLEYLPNKACGFMCVENRWCRIQELLGIEQKPLVCQAYPIAIKIVDAVTKEYFLDTGCPFIEAHVSSYARLKDLTKVEEVEGFLRDNFPAEFEAACQIVNRLSWIPLRLRQLETEGKIHVPDEFSSEQWAEALPAWSRVDLIPGKM